MFYLSLFSNVMYSCDRSWIYSIITPVFSVTWSFRNHCCSGIISDYYYYYYHQCWKQFLLFNIFVELV